MDLGLEGTAAIVGGASSGIGLAISHALAAEGCRVTMLARDPERLEAAATDVPRSLAIAGDVRDRSALERAVDRTTAQAGRLDIIVNNAGGPPPGTFETTDEDAYKAAFELSFEPAVRLAKIALPHLRESGRGRIVNITSWSVREPIADLILSNAVRPGVVGWAKTLSHELGPAGITVNTVAPGRIDTPRTRQLGHAAARFESVPAQRPGRPEEVGAAVAFLCSTQAAYITGTVLPVDGGALRGVW